MQSLMYLIFAVLGFVIPFGISLAIGNEQVQNIVLLVYIIQWVAFIPAYMFQTEKFFDLTGSITYSSVFIYCIYLTTSGDLNWGSLVISILVILTHKPNIYRLLNKDENKMKLKLKNK